VSGETGARSPDLGGIALHAGNLPGYPASHGCIRLPMAFSEKLSGSLFEKSPSPKQESIILPDANPEVARFRSVI
jgi:hypothetical protein